MEISPGGYLEKKNEKTIDLQSTKEYHKENFSRHWKSIYKTPLYFPPQEFKKKFKVISFARNTSAFPARIH